MFLGDMGLGNVFADGGGLDLLSGGPAGWVDSFDFASFGSIMTDLVDYGGIMGGSGTLWERADSLAAEAGQYVTVTPDDMGGVLIEAPLRGYDGLSYYYYQSPGSMPAEIIRDSTTGGDLPSMETYI